MKNLITAGINYLYLSIPMPSQSVIDEIYKGIFCLLISVGSQRLLKPLPPIFRKKKPKADETN